MILTTDEILDTLRLDADEAENLIIANTLVEAIPSYVSIATGRDEIFIGNNPLEKTVAKFILTLWFNPDGTDSVALQRTIDHLLKVLKVSAIK